MILFKKLNIHVIYLIAFYVNLIKGLEIKNNKVVNHPGNLNCTINNKIGDELPYNDYYCFGEKGWIVKSLDSENNSFVWHYTGKDYEEMGRKVMLPSLNKRQSGVYYDVNDIYSYVGSSSAFRMSSISSSASDCPALVAVAQHGCIDDMVYFQVQGAIDVYTWSKAKYPQSQQVNMYTDQKCKHYAATYPVDNCLLNMEYLSHLPFAEYTWGGE